MTILRPAGGVPAPKRTRRIRVVAAAAAAGLLAAACTGPSSPDTGPSTRGAKRSVTIAYVGALSGPGSALVTPGFQAARLAFEQANEGEVGDIPVTIGLVGEDTQGNATTAASVVAGFVDDPSVVGVIGPASSSDSGAAGALLDDAKIPFMTPSAADPGLAQNGWTHWFRAVANVNYQGPTAANYIANHLVPNCAVVASDDSSYGRTIAEIVQSTLDGDGVTVVSKLGVVRYPGQKHFDDLVGAIKDAGCRVAFYGGYAAQAGALRAQLSKAGLGGVTLMGADAIEDDAFITAAGKAAGGTIATCFCADVTTSSDPAARAFVAQYMARYGQRPGLYAAEAWDVAQMYIAAFKAGKIARSSVTDFFRTLRGFQGVTKTYTFAGDGELEPSAAAIYLYQVQGGAWTTLGVADQPGSG